MKRPSLCCLLALLGLRALPAAGLEPYLVKDINQVPAPDSSQPHSFATFQGAVFFGADSGNHADLWRSDGTEAGTWPVLETCQADCPYNPFPLAVTEDRYFFDSNGGGSGLWVTGGDAASTFLLTANPVEPWNAVWARSQRVLYFPAWDAGHGMELWRSDGTPAGTRLAADLRPGPAGSHPHGLVELGGRVYFLAADAHGRGEALWRTDGTAGGTVLVKALEKPDRLTVLGNRLILTAAQPAGGTGLWQSDGTGKGTARIAEITRGKVPAELGDFVVIGGRLYFVAGRYGGMLHLWVTDGTPAGTRTLARVATASYPPTPAVLGNRVFFAGFDPAHGRELWATDGTPAGTRLVRDVCPGPCWGVNGDMLFPHQGRLYFAGLTPDEGSEPWVTDGTAAGTHLVRDICPGDCNSGSDHPAAIDGRMVFIAVADPVSWYQVWSTDGTEAGTVQLSHFEDSHDIHYFSFSEPVAGGLLFPGADPEHGTEIWRTDGTPEGTRFLKDLNTGTIGGSYVEPLGAAGGRAFFYADDGEHGRELWTSDGTEAGTALVHELIPGPEPPRSDETTYPAASAGDRLVYLRRVDKAMTLWASDGTREGTQPLAELDGSCCFEFMLSAGDKVFLGFDGDRWASDGTAAGTRKFQDTHSILGSTATFQGDLWFTSYAGGTPRLWRSDGTEAGTLLFDDSLSDVSSLTVHEDRLWFVADDGEHGHELWSTDGTAAGTVLERDLVPGPDDLSVRSFAWAGDRLVFTVGEPWRPATLWVYETPGTAPRRLTSAEVSSFLQFAGLGRVFLSDPSGGQLWVSDGTEEGTAPLHDTAGNWLYGIVQIEELGGRLLIASGWNGGGDLWESDGTPAGTVRLPIRTLLEGRPLLKAGSRIFFGSFDHATGWELWALRP